MNILDENATLDEKVAFVMEQADDPAVRRALYRRLVKKLDKAEAAVADAKHDLDVFATALEAAFGEPLRPRRRR